jgi:hypothetical protein
VSERCNSAISAPAHSPPAMPNVRRNRREPIEGLI